MDYSQIPLHPMQLPEAIGWWPLAIGWWLLAVLVVLAVVLVVATAVRWLRRRRKDPRRLCLAEFEKIKQRFEQNADKAELLVSCSSLLKRSALTLFPRQDVAALSGERWLEFLLAQSKGCDKSQFQCLVDGPYRPQAQAQMAADALLAGCRQWLKTAGKGNKTDV